VKENYQLTSRAGLSDFSTAVFNEKHNFTGSLHQSERNSKRLHGHILLFRILQGVYVIDIQ
jgi:hypothetical protein